MKWLKAILNFIRRSRVLKYAVVVAVAVVVIGFADENSVWSHLQNVAKINELKDEISRYRSQYERDQAQLRQIDRDPKAIEKIARERYFMKADDEDIFVLSDDVQFPQDHDDETTE